MVIRAPAYGLLSLGLLWSIAFLTVFDKTFRHLFAPLMLKVADIGIARVHPFGFLRKIVHNVEAWTADGIGAAERGLTYSINQFIDSAALLFGVPLAIGLALLELAQYVVHHAPRVVTKVVHETVTKPLTKVVKTTAAVTKAQFNHLTHRVDVLAHRVAAVARSAGHAVAAPFPRLGRLEKTVKGQAKRLTKIEKALAVGASAALVWTALRKLGLSWLRCRNVTKTGKALCGMNPDLLESLLGSALLLTGAISLRDLARELEEPTKLVADGLHALIEEF